MGSPTPRGPGRTTAPAGAAVVEWMTTGQMLAILHAEGFHVTPRMVGHALRLELLPAADRVSGWRRWTRKHLAAMRRYLREHSRVQRGPTIGGGA